MIGKDGSAAGARALAGTGPGRAMLARAALRTAGYREFARYRAEADAAFPGFARRFARDLHGRMGSDPSPGSTQQAFADEVGSAEMALDPSGLEAARARLASPGEVEARVGRILDSNFVKMTFPVLNALFDGAAEHAGRDDPGLRRDVVEGHILAIDLSEPMDRITDRDEDLEYLDDYRLMNPYILALARERISRAGDRVLAAFEEGFRDARRGQDVDAELKSRPGEITEAEMVASYDKYRAVMGTAGLNMALAERPLGEAFRAGMARAAEGVGCGNEMEDSARDGAVKVPSWPLYYTVLTGDVGRGFALALGRGRAYLREARLALGALPDGFPRRRFLEFLFLAVGHYNEHWYGRIRGSPPPLPGCAS